YVIAAIDAIDSLRKEKIELKILGGRDDPLQTDMYLVRDDRPTPPGFSSSTENSRSFLAEKRQSQFIMDHSKDGVYVALPSNISIEQIHFPHAHHGHNEKLIPDNSLFTPFKPTDKHVEFDSEEPPSLSNEEIDALNSLTVSSFTKYHQLYAGIAQLENSGLVTSRHIRHPDNQRVVEALQRQFTEIGGPEVMVSRHRFPHENIFLDNVVAEFSGTEPESFVLVTAHLDSTAAFGDGPYNPASDPAPGSDDDASGVAAVLAIAEVIAKARQTRRAKRSIRFVLFNAEEHGLVGSKAYARRQASLQAQITAVFQMDMIGYKGVQSSAPHQFEVHVGFFPSEDVEQRSFLLANTIQQIAQTVSPLLGNIQVYPAPSGEDPAAGRSDHAPFQERGYAACVISEDFFAGPNLDSPEETPNPDYHKPTDLTIDYEYAASIARVVAAAALIAANA
ncbi:M28 family metallopeptidase, partial [bacterium]|nr:M28 family metallopeptidase [bacterium]